MLQEILNIWKVFNEKNVRYVTIGGLAVNIYGYTRNTGDIDILIEDTLENRKNFRVALKEIGIMESLCNNILDELIIMDYDEFKYIVDKVDVMEDNIDKTQHQFAVNQLIRLKEKKCSTENSIIYTKILTDFERIGDHGLNIAESLYHIRKIMKQMKMIKPEIEEA